MAFAGIGMLLLVGCSDHGHHSPPRLTDKGIIEGTIRVIGGPVPSPSLQPTASPYPDVGEPLHIIGQGGNQIVVSTDTHGHFSAVVRAGAYTVASCGGRQRVTVRPGRNAVLSLYCANA